MRCLCVTLTSLPGPAPHCETLAAYNPPQGWHDVATRMGPLMGDFRTCGDLLFSGHTAWTTVSMLLVSCNCWVVRVGGERGACGMLSECSGFCPWCFAEAVLC